MSGAQFSNGRDARSYCLAGHARITLVDKKSGARFTYKIRQPEGKPHFVSVLVGPDNEADYRFLGTIFSRQIYSHEARSRIAFEAPSATAFDYAWSFLALGQLPKGVEVWHEGVCGRCGRTLTVPESIARGIGPICANE
jgi:hypothetical protein